MSTKESGGREPGDSSWVHVRLYSSCFLGRRGTSVRVGYGQWRLGESGRPACLLNPLLSADECSRDQATLRPLWRQLKHFGVAHLNRPLLGSPFRRRRDRLNPCRPITTVNMGSCWERRQPLAMSPAIKSAGQGYEVHRQCRADGSTVKSPRLINSSPLRCGAPQIASSSSLSNLRNRSGRHHARGMTKTRGLGSENFNASP